LIRAFFSFYQATTMSGRKSKPSTSASAKLPVKGRILSGFEALLGNGEELSRTAFMGYGAVNFVHDLHSRVGQDLQRLLSWARWNKREAPKDKIKSLRDSIVAHLEMGDDRIAVPIPVQVNWVTDPNKLAKSIDGKSNDELPMVSFKADQMRHEDLRPFGGNVSSFCFIFVITHSFADNYIIILRCGDSL
jgi:hypothetical protein